MDRVVQIPETVFIRFEMAEERLEPVRETIRRGEERLSQSRSTLARAKVAEETSGRILQKPRASGNK